MNNPAAGLSITDGSTQTQVLTTTPGQVVAFNATGGNLAPFPTDGTTRADQANSRLLACRGWYVVEFDITLANATGAVDCIAQIYKNNIAIPDGSARVTVPTTGRGVASASVLIKVNDTDIPGTIQSFPDPSDPSPAYVGQGGAPLNVTPITLKLSSVSGT